MSAAIERSYRCRGEVVHVRELTDVEAVRAPAAESEKGAGGPAPRHVRAPEAADVAGLVPEDVLPQVRALEAAGWAIVPRRRAAEGLKVYLTPENRVALDSGRLTVRVNARHTEAEARGLLERLGFSIIQPLRLASNLFSVAAPSGGDAVAAAGRLADSEGVVFAEPELIEAMSHR